jgi:predicted nucleic acid-binding protein
MDNQAHQSIVDEVFTLLAPKGFTRAEVEEQLTQLMKVCILRLEHALMKEASFAPQSLTFSSWEKFLKECAERNPELHGRITREFSSLLEEYLKEVTGV